MQHFSDFVCEKFFGNKNKIFSMYGANNEYQQLQESFMASHNVDRLIEKFAKHYDINKEDIYKFNGNYKAVNFAIPIKDIKVHLTDEWLYKTLYVYGYYLTFRDYDYVVFEPIFSENITDFIQDDCAGKIYKIVSLKTLESIKNRGGIAVDKDEIHAAQKAASHSANLNIRKQANRDLNKNTIGRLNKFMYRDFFSRSFFFAAKTTAGLKEAKQEILRQLGLTEYAILEIDISRYNVNCYLDNYSDIDYSRKDYRLLYINAFFPMNIIKIHDQSYAFE